MNKRQIREFYKKKGWPGPSWIPFKDEEQDELEQYGARFFEDEEPEDRRNP